MAREQRIEVANFAEGIKAFPAYERSSGRAARRVLNGEANPDGELVPRRGFSDISDSTTVWHISPLGVIDVDTPETGPLAVCRASDGDDKHFRLPEGASWTQEGDRLFFTTPSENRHGYWVDIITNDIYQWTGTERPAYFTSEDLNIGRFGGDTEGLSHPLLVGLTGNAPTSESPISIFFQTGVGGLMVKAMTVKIKADIDNAKDTEFWALKITSGIRDPKDTNKNQIHILPFGSSFEIIWDGEDSTDTEEFNIRTGETVETSVGKVSRGGHPRSRGRKDGDATKGYNVISQAEFENAYLEVTYTLGDDETHKYRYYLYSHRDSNVAGDIGASLQAGLSVGGTVSSIPGVGAPLAIGAGALVATAGIAGSLIAKAGEGERIQLQRVRNSITPAGINENGFFPGLFVMCYTFSESTDRGYETLPSQVVSVFMFEFDSNRIGARQGQFLRVNLPKHDYAIPDWASCVNIYAAKASRDVELYSLPQGTGLEFKLVGQAERTPGFFEWRGVNVFADSSNEYSFSWRDERILRPEGFLTTTDNDSPSDTLDCVVSYGGRIWGVERKDNSISYSKVGANGQFFFPNDNALVPQNFELEDSQWTIIKIHPAPSDSMLYVFKENRIHFIRGHGEIQGLYAPSTPVEVNLDASLKNDSVGTLSPNSVVTFKNRVMFLGSDSVLYELVGTSVRQFSISIQPIINKYRYTNEELKGVYAFEWENRFHLGLPPSAACDEAGVLVVDLEQGGYWTMFDWDLTQAERLHAYHRDGRLLKLYDAVDDAGESFPVEWESNPVKTPPEKVISGVYVYHTSDASPVKVGVRSTSEGDNPTDFTLKEYTPKRGNRYKKGTYEKGQRVSILFRDENPVEEKLRIDRIELGV